MTVVRFVNSLLLPSALSAEQILVGLALAAAIAIVSFALRMLSAGGAAVQFVLGWLLFTLGGWQWTIPILVFFLSSSILSKYSSRMHAPAKRAFAKQDVRDAYQVLANGGAAGVFVSAWFLSGSEVLYIASLGGLASGAADTWGTEIGITSGSFPRLITSQEPVEPGRSGALSLRGVLGGAAGSLAVAASSICWLREETAGFALVSIVGAGILGSTVDSFLGATVQGQYRCSLCGALTERVQHCEIPTSRLRGAQWFGNDLVNLACSISGSAIAVALYWILSSWF